MKIVIAPDSFKESLTAIEAAECIEAGFKEIFPDACYVLLPMADGGEGTVEALLASTQGERVECRVSGPLGTPVTSVFGITGAGTAIIEMAAASGLELLSLNERNPLLTTTYGTGELIKHALDRGVKHIILGIGGSATNDGGVGMMQALGGHFLDCHGKEIEFGGAALENLSRINLDDLDARLHSCIVELACDVDNPLVGPRGASVVFGPQKGATQAMAIRLDANLLHYSNIIERDFGIDIRETKGAGAGGGIAAAALAFLNAKIRPGIEIVMEANRLAEALKDADLVLTGEGSMDRQTISGKTPVGVARVAKHYGIPVIAIAGAVSADAAVVHNHGIDAVFSILHRISDRTQAFAQARDNLKMAARNIAAVLRISADIAEKSPVPGGRRDNREKT